MTVKRFRSPLLSRHQKDLGPMRVCGLLPEMCCTLILFSPRRHI